MLGKIVNKETISYLFFGVLTTVVNYGVFWLVTALFGHHLFLIANVAAFVAATAFAYITNKLYVFHSKSWNWAVLRKEIVSFLSARLLSFGFEELGLFVCGNLLKLDKTQWMGVNGIMVAKVVLSFVVVAINYFLSKFIIFKKKSLEEDME